MRPGIHSHGVKNGPFSTRELRDCSRYILLGIECLPFAVKHTAPLEKKQRELQRAQQISK